jgi:hypothetical protein
VKCDKRTQAGPNQMQPLFRAAAASGPNHFKGSVRRDERGVACRAVAYQVDRYEIYCRHQ